ncbi:MAG TPA: hypothetical protein VEC12_06125 [Bacteroidia bacterium]|nr:hypothetical protein [Bacteroidia bacterium]
MDTLLIEVTNDKALGLIKELEELRLIKVLKRGLMPKDELERANVKKKPSDYAGSISVDKAAEMLKQIEESRNEWEKNF